MTGCTSADGLHRWAVAEDNDEWSYYLCTACGAETQQSSS